MVTLPITVPQATCPGCKEYCSANIYESATETGTYLLVAQVEITNETTSILYQDGDSSKWYRIGFVECGSGGVETGISTPMQGTSGGSCGGPYNNRMSGRICGTIKLDTNFYRNGKLADPYAIREIKIYKKSVEDANLVMVVPIPMPGTSDYPFPITTDSVGVYSLQLEIPKTFEAPDIYFDQWWFISDLNCLDDPSGSGFDPDDETYWQYKCNKFWVYPDGWYVDDKLMVPNLGFEPLTVQFRAGETKWLEVGVMPLPLYDFNYNQIMPMIPYICPTITFKTKNNEILIQNAKMEIGLRQGTYRSNPFVFKYLVDTSKFIIGTYNYQVTAALPDGQTLVSPQFTITVS